MQSEEDSNVGDPRGEDEEQVLVIVTCPSPTVGGDGWWCYAEKGSRPFPMEESMHDEPEKTENDNRKASDGGARCERRVIMHRHGIW